MMRAARKRKKTSYITLPRRLTERCTWRAVVFAHHLQRISVGGRAISNRRELCADLNWSVPCVENAEAELVEGGWVHRHAKGRHLSLLWLEDAGTSGLDVPLPAKALLDELSADAVHGVVWRRRVDLAPVRARKGKRYAKPHPYRRLATLRQLEAAGCVRLVKTKADEAIVITHLRGDRSIEAQDLTREHHSWRPAGM